MENRILVSAKCGRHLVKESISQVQEAIEYAKREDKDVILTWVKVEDTINPCVEDFDKGLVWSFPVYSYLGFEEQLIPTKKEIKATQKKIEAEARKEAEKLQKAQEKAAKELVEANK